MAKLEGYKFGKTIGKGSQGTVKIAIHVATGEEVAIKVAKYEGFVEKDNGAEEITKKKGLREMMVVRHVRHPNIVICYGVYRSDKRDYIVMELMKGRSLLSYLQERGCLLEHEARKYFRQLISAVSYFHGLLIAHRDLKPGNLLLDETNTVLKVCDFGACNYMRYDYKLDSFRGTPFYQAPEVVTRAGNYDGRQADIFSCGIILFHLLFEPPDCDNTVKGQPIPSKKNNVHPIALDLISRMTEHDPKRRITLADIKKNPWFLDGDDTFLDPAHQVLEIDNDVLSETLKIHYSEDEVLNEAKRTRRDELIEDIIMTNHSEELVTYELLKMKKMRMKKMQEIEK